MADAIKTYIFSGISGVKKEKVLKRLRRYYLLSMNPQNSLSGLSGEAFEVAADKYIPIIEIGTTSLAGRTAHSRVIRDDLLSELNGFSIQTKKEWQGTEKPLLVFLHTHITTHTEDHFRSWVDIVDPAEIFSHLDIQIVVNFIDNIFVCRDEMNGIFTITQILTWRNVEEMMSNALALRMFGPRALSQKHKVFSVNHSMKNLASLIFTPAKPCVYLAFPISAPRRWESSSDKRLQNKAEEMYEQNSHFRSYFEDEFTVFDPSTIDELPLVAKLGTETEFDEKAEIVVTEKELWPRMASPEELVSACQSDRWAVPASEVARLRTINPQDWPDTRNSSVGQHVKHRDFQLIDQSEALIVYRPTSKEHAIEAMRWSASVEIEVREALSTNKPVFIIKDSSDAEIVFQGQMAPHIPPQYIHESDLSTPEARDAAFQAAKDSIKEQIDARNRSYARYAP